MKVLNPYWPETLVVKREHCVVCRFPTAHTVSCMVSLCNCLVLKSDSIKTVANPHWPTSKVQVKVGRKAAAIAKVFRTSSGESEQP